MSAVVYCLLSQMAGTKIQLKRAICESKYSFIKFYIQLLYSIFVLILTRHSK